MKGNNIFYSQPMGNYDFKPFAIMVKNIYSKNKDILAIESTILKNFNCFYNNENKIGLIKKKSSNSQKKF